MAEASPSPCPESLADVFRLTRLPASLRFNAFLRRRAPFRWMGRFLEKACDATLRSRWIGHEGEFLYHRAGEAQGRRVRFDGRNAQFHALYDPCYEAGYEPETALLLWRLARHGEAFYDIGSNWGYFSMLIAAATDRPKAIYAFEPNPAVVRDLSRCLREAGLEEVVTVLNMGAGRESTELHLELPDAFKTGIGRLRTSGRGIRVPVRPLDELNLHPPTVIKIDAEGMEVDVLLGARQLLRQHRPFVVLESFLDFERPEETRRPIELLHSLGYQLFNPTLSFTADGGPMLASYADPIAGRLQRSPSPPLCLVPVTPVNRYLMRGQLNLLAAHPDRLATLPAKEFIVAAGL